MAATASTGINALGLTGLTGRFTFSLATAGTTRKWFFLPQGVDSFSVEMAWPTTGTPVGAFTFEATNNGSAETGTPMAITARASFVAEQPGGAADTGRFFVDSVPCSGKYICVAYTRVSGGAGNTATMDISFKVKG